VSAAEPKPNPKRRRSSLRGATPPPEAKIKRKGSLAEFFMNSPLRGADLDLTRMRDEPREIDLGDEEPPNSAGR